MSNTTVDAVISKYMSQKAKDRWKNTTPEAKRKHMSMMGKESGKARKPRKTRAK